MKIDRSLKLIPVALTAVALLAACDTGDKPSQQGAAVMCEKFIEKDGRVKSPGSLKFSDSTDSSETKIRTVHGSKPWKYFVQGFIDSQDEIGVLRRNNYQCTVSTKDNKTWTLDGLSFPTNN